MCINTDNDCFILWYNINALVNFDKHVGPVGGDYYDFSVL